jgi:hypothetical protein
LQVAIQVPFFAIPSFVSLTPFALAFAASELHHHFAKLHQVLIKPLLFPFKLDLTFKLVGF